MNKIIKNKKIIAWGVGNAFINFVRKYTSVKIEYAVDDFTYNCEVAGTKVYRPEKLLQENKEEVFVLIFTLSSNIYQTISKKLQERGFIINKHFSDYSFIIKDQFASEMRQYGIELKDEWYSVVKSLFSNLTIPNHSSLLGTWLIYGLLFKSKNISGDIVELGVYKGGNAFCSALFINLMGDKRKQILVDSFEGFGKLSEHDPVEHKNLFKDVSYEEVSNYFSDFNNTQILKGHIPKILNSLHNKNYSFVYYDCDLYEPTLDSLNYFFPKISEGGFFLIDDYCVTKDFLGVQKAVKQFCKEHKLDIIEIPETTQGLIIKKK